MDFVTLGDPVQTVKIWNTWSRVWRSGRRTAEVSRVIAGSSQGPDHLCRDDPVPNARRYECKTCSHGSSHELNFSQVFHKSCLQFNFGPANRLVYMIITNVWFIPSKCLIFLTVKYKKISFLFQRIYISFAYSERRNKKSAIYSPTFQQLLKCCRVSIKYYQILEIHSCYVICTVLNVFKSLLNLNNL